MNLPGLNHQLGDDIDALREAVRAFVQKELAPRAADIDRDNLFPADMWKKLGDLGLHGLGIVTGIDLDRLVDAGAYISEQLGRPSGSRVGRALMAKRVG